MGIVNLKQKIEACEICIKTPYKTPLPHQPRPVVQLSDQAKICIAGQAPGLRVHQSGLPFDDASGDRLRSWLGVERPTFYDANQFAIVPMGFCFPGYNAKKSDLPPRKECAPAWREAVFEAMPQIELILVIGQYAQAYHMKDLRAATLTATVANWREILRGNRWPQVLPLPHPSWRNSAWLKNNQWFETELLPVLQENVQKLIIS